MNYILVFIQLFLHSGVSNTKFAYVDSIIMKHSLEFYTQYNQFYVCDKNSDGAQSQDFWNDLSYNERLATSDDILGIGTQSYGHIRGSIVILDSINNNIDLGKYDHIVEAGLKIKSGSIQIQTCPSSSIELEIKIAPGTYRVRIYTTGINGTDMDEDEGIDRYVIEIWPDNNIERKVLKQYTQ